jgi:hypothetical protein
VGAKKTVMTEKKIKGFFTCQKCRNVCFTNVGHVRVFSDIIQPKTDVEMCTQCKSCYVWIKGEVYNVTEMINLEDKEKLS